VQQRRRAILTMTTMGRVHKRLPRHRRLPASRVMQPRHHEAPRHCGIRRMRSKGGRRRMPLLSAAGMPCRNLADLLLDSMQAESLYRSWKTK
jgi:hypothetical protein